MKNQAKNDEQNIFSKIDDLSYIYPLYLYVIYKYFLVFSANIAKELW